MSDYYCGDNCNHTGPHRYPPQVGANIVITHCIHGLDLRLYPRCYLCRPEPVGDVHGYTCGQCQWGRDRPRMLADYVAHVNAEHPLEVGL